MQNRTINPDKNIVLEVTSYPTFKGTVAKVNRLLTHCQNTLTPEECDLNTIIKDIKIKNADFLAYINKQILIGSDYKAVDFVYSQVPLQTITNTQEKTRDEIFNTTFNQMDYLKNYILKEMVSTRQQNPTNPIHISINAADYINEYQKLFSSMDNLYSYFEPTNEDLSEKTVE